MRAAVVIAVTVAGTVPASAAAAVPAKGPVPVFNVPSGTVGQQNAIAHHIDALTAATPRGGLIRIAVYQFTSPEFARLLVGAKRRGVRVRMVVDAGSRTSAAYRQVARALGTSRARSSWVVACHRGCIGNKIMHNKFFLFSRTGHASDVVVQSSANMTTGNRVNAWNNAVTISDARIYRAYGRYFAALAARRRQPSHYRVTRSGPYTLYTFPRAGRTSRSDTLYTELGHVGCAGGTSVHLTTFMLTRLALARRLWSLAHQGCDVRVIYTNLGRGARRVLARPGGPKLLSSHYSYPDRRTGRPVEAFVHSKYIAIGGTYGGRERRLVITGSPNHTTPGLRRNDEAMLKIVDAGVYAAYERNFAALWRAASSRSPLGGRVPEPY